MEDNSSFNNLKLTGANVSVLLIATNKYKQFVEPLIAGIAKNFLPDHPITVHLFSDAIHLFLEPPTRITIVKHLIPPYGFPEATLLRYKIFNDHSNSISGDYVFYMDVDMEITGIVTSEILTGDIIATRHPGFYTNNGWGSPNNNPESLSYLPAEHCKKYFAGGFQGGKTKCYLQMAKILACNIDNDLANSIIAEWHDETHFNYFCNYLIGMDFPDWKLTEMLPSYCSPESEELRKAWAIDQLPTIIIALDKNHEEIRS